MSLYLMLALGFILLLAGGELLVRGSVSLAERLGMSPLLIGVVLVGFGTSMPEMVTSVEASLAGSPGIAVGNIVGSNLANTLLVLGLSALIVPIAISPIVASRDGIFVLASTLAFVAIGYVLSLDRMVGAALLIGLAFYIWITYRQEKLSFANDAAAKKKSESKDFDGKALSSEVAALAVRSQTALPIGMTLVGLALLIIGGKILVDGARGIALEAGVSETIIGLTIVAVGTSLPEMVTCVIAAIRRHGDVALGNVMGSNIYNLLAIGGVTAVISPTVIPPEIVRFDNLVLLAATITLVVLLRVSKKVGRIQGALLLAGYVAYIAVLWPA